MTEKRNISRIQAFLAVTSTSLALTTYLHVCFNEPPITGTVALLRFFLIFVWALMFFYSVLMLLRGIVIRSLDVQESDGRLAKLPLLLLPGLLWFACLLLGQSAGKTQTTLLLLCIPVIVSVVLFLLLFKTDLRRRPAPVSNRAGNSNILLKVLIPIFVILFAIGTDRALTYAFFKHGTANNRNVILISIDTLRPDYLGCYEAKHGVSPAIDAFAKKGTLFERAYSTAPCTLPAHMTIMTGLVPPEHGIRQAVPPKVVSLDQTIPTMAEFLNRNSYLTIGIVNGGYLNSSYGFDRGFDSYTSLGYSPDRPTRTLDEAISFLETLDRGREFFLFVHTFGVHNYFDDVGGLKAFTPPISEEKASELKQAYRKRIALIDRKLGKLFAILEKEELYQNTLVIFTADHGEGFREHGQFGHGNSLYNELLSIPMILKCPLLPQGEKVASPVSLIDLMPTVLHWTGIESDRRFSGRSLIKMADKARPGIEDRPIFSERNGTVGYSMLLVDGTYGDDQQKREKLHEEFENISFAGYALISGKYKYVTYPESNREWLFDTTADPGETVNLALQEKQLLEQQRIIAETYVGGLATRQGDKKDLSQKLEKQLKALGYIQ